MLTFNLAGIFFVLLIFLLYCHFFKQIFLPHLITKDIFLPSIKKTKKKKTAIDFAQIVETYFSYLWIPLIPPCLSWTQLSHPVGWVSFHLKLIILFCYSNIILIEEIVNHSFWYIFMPSSSLLNELVHDWWWWWYRNILQWIFKLFFHIFDC